MSTFISPWQYSDWLKSVHYWIETESRVVVSLAERIGYVNRALTWQTLISQLPEEVKHQYAQAVPAYLREYLNAG